MIIDRHGRLREGLLAAGAGLLLGATAWAVATRHSQVLDLAIVAELGLIVALAVRDLRRLLLILVVIDTPLQWAKNFGWNASAANLGAYGGLNVSVTTIALLGLYILWGLERGRPRSGAPPARWGPALPLIAYVAINAVSVAVARNHLLGIDQVALLGQTLLLFVYVVSTVRTRADVELLATALVGSLLLESVLIIAFRVTGYQFRFGGLASHTEAGTTAAQGRLGGTIGGPNTAAAFLELLIPLAAAMLVTPVARRVRQLCVVAIVLGIAAMIITQSRGGWGSLAISAVVLGVVAVRRGMMSWRAAATTLAVVCVVAAPFSPTVIHRLTGNDNGSTASRLSTSSLAVNMIRTHPLLGVGADNVAVNLRDYAGPAYDGQWIYTVHDKYLLVWAEAGPLALLAFVWFLGATLRRGWRAATLGDPLLSPIALGLLAGVIGELAHMAVDLFSGRPQVQLLWMVAALLTAILAILERERGASMLRGRRRGDLGHRAPAPREPTAPGESGPGSGEPAREPVRA